MRDTSEINLKFVKIVERYPEIYDPTRESYRMRYASDNAWDKVAADVKKEFNEDCTPEELKTKWKGIRSSFSRFRTKLLNNDFGSTPCKKYYLYDSLQFLEPFTKCKSIPQNSINKGEAEASFQDNRYYVDVDIDNSTEYDPNLENWEDHDIKPDIGGKDNEKESSDSGKDCKSPKIKKRKHKYKGDDSKNSEENEDLQFFRSILPDIRDFTSKEKRKFKRGILQLIDEIEDERKQPKSNNEVTSS